MNYNEEAVNCTPITIEENDYITPSFYLELLNSDLDKLIKNDSYSLIGYYENNLFDNFLSLGRSLLDIANNEDIYSTDIICYLSFKEGYEGFVNIYDHLMFYLSRAKQENEHSVYENISESNVQFMKNMNIVPKGTFDKYMNKLEGESNALKSYFNDVISDKIELLKTAWEKMSFYEEFRDKDEMLEFVISEFRRFVKMDKYHLHHQLKVPAQQFKTNKLEKLTKEHWAMLAEVEDSLIQKIIKEESVDVSSCKDLYDSSGLKDLIKHKDLLRMLRETSDPESLFDWKILFQQDELFDRYVTGNNVMYFFGQVHRQNLIKCELYDGLKEQYQQFIYGTNVTNGNNNEPQLSGIPEQQFIHQQIDENKLIDFIRSYTDGPNKSSYFINKSQWISIYVILRQKQKKLGNKPIFLVGSRPKFVEWLNSKVRPLSVPCDKNTLDNAPKYLRDEKNYPWDIDKFFKSGGEMENTYNSYSMITDYFQENLIDKIEDFFRTNDSIIEDLSF